MPVTRGQQQRAEVLKQQLKTTHSQATAAAADAKSIKPFTFDDQLPVDRNASNCQEALETARRRLGSIRVLLESLTSLGAEWETLRKVIDTPECEADYIQFVSEFDLPALRQALNEAEVFASSSARTIEFQLAEYQDIRKEHSAANSARHTPKMSSPQPTRLPETVHPHLIANQGEPPTVNPLTVSFAPFSTIPTAQLPNPIVGLAHTLANMQPIFDSHSNPPLHRTQAPSHSFNLPSGHAHSARPSVNGISVPVHRSEIKLPKLEPLKFNGSFEDFKSWRSWFTSTVHDQPIPDVHKAQYLVALVEDKARDVIQHIPLTQYTNILAALDDAFDRPDQVIESSIRKFESLSRLRSNHELPSLLVAIKAIDRSLQTQGMTLDSPLVLHRIENLLTPTLLLELRRYRQGMRDNWNLKSMLQILTSLQSVFAELRAAPPNDRLYTRSFATFDSNRPSYPCLFCDSADHQTTRCTAYSSIASRKNRLQELKRCFRCLSSDHFATACSKVCRKCQGPHHRLICAEMRMNRTLISVETEATPAHFDELEREIDTIEEESPEQDASEGVEEPARTFVAKSDNRHLPTCHVRVQHSCDPTKQSRALTLFDSGADANYVTDDLTDHLQLKKLSTKRIQNEVFGGKQTTTTSAIVELVLPLTNGQQLTTQAYSIPNIVRDLDVLEFQRKTVVSSRKRPQLLLGWNICKQVMQMRIEDHGSIQKVRTLLGDVLTTADHKPRDACTHTVLVNQTPDQQIAQFWDLDRLGMSENLSADDINQNLWQNFKNTTTQQTNGQYEVGWLWNEQKSSLPTNFELALRRTLSTIRRMQSDQTSLDHFRTILNQQLESGIIEKVISKSDSGNLRHYLPYQLVRKDSPTTPIRVVYDASAKCGKSLSLNDCVHIGPLNLVAVVGILLRARSGRLLVVSDISKAFHRLLLKPDDRDAVRFLVPIDWNKPIGRVNVQVMRFRSVPFGVAASPSLLDMTIRLHLSKIPELSDHVKSIYVDNIVRSYNSVEEAVRDSLALRDHLSKANFPLQEYASNSSDVLQQIGEQVDDQSSTTKLLGIRWNFRTDTLLIAVRPEKAEQLTKRMIASRVVKVFDPMGLLAPIFVHAKIFLQELWKQKTTWDESLPSSQTEKWNSIEHEWKGEFEIPRFFALADSSSRQLHVFADASQHAYGVAAYLVTIDQRNTRNSKLVMAKSRVTPKALQHDQPQLSIPKLELLALVIATRTADFITRELARFDSVVIWSDSMIALQQAANPQNTKSVFVRNRAIEATNCRDRMEFRHVETQDNPADLVSRGTTAATLQRSILWWNGPSWLVESSLWPSTLVLPMFDNSTQHIETTDRVVSLVNIETSASAQVGNDWNESIQLTITRLRALNDSRLPANRDTAEAVLIRHAQQSFPPSERKTKKLRLQSDDLGVLRSINRLQFSELPASVKRPIWLPTQSPVTEQIVMHTHDRMLHAGPATVLAELRQRFYINAKAVKRAQVSCPNCRLEDARPFATPPWAQLPDERTSIGRPFQVTGVDLAGPLHSKDGDYFIVIFVCAKTRGIHLESTRSTSTADFLLAFDRFEARRGCPQLMISDNAQNFRTAAQLLLKRLQAHMSFSWRHITPRAPWRGGMYERLIQHVKSALKRSIGRSSWPLIRIDALIVKIETAVNSRPLLRESTGTILRPIDFLRPQGQENAPVDFSSVEELADETYVLEAPKRLHRQLVTQHNQQTSKLQQFWSIWSRLYLTSLIDNEHEAEHRRSVSRMPQIGEPVLVHDEFSSRARWPIGTITKIEEARDGPARTIEVTVENGHVFRRAVNHVYPLEVRTETIELPTSPVSSLMTPASSPLPPATNESSEQKTTEPAASDEPTTRTGADEPTAQLPTATSTRQNNSKHERLPRKAKTAQRSWMQSIVPLLTVILSVFALSSFADAAKICFPGSPTNFWPPPKWPQCPPSLMHADLRTVEKEYEVFIPNYGEHPTTAYLCTFHHRTVKGYLDFRGLPHIHEEQQTDLPITAENCWQMVHDNVCQFGHLRKVGDSWHTRTQVHLDLPNRFWSIFDYAKKQQKDCSTVETRVLTRHGAKTISSNAGPTLDCKYSRGECQVALNKVLVWTPEPTAECAYSKLGVWTGDSVGSDWFSQKHQIYLDVTNSTVNDCGISLNLTRQGWAIRDSNSSRSRRETTEPDNRSNPFVDTSQFAAENRFLQQQLIRNLAKQVRTNCELVEQRNRLLTELLLANPQRTMERLFDNSAIQVQTLGNYLRIRWCKLVADRKLRFKSMAKCTAEIPVGIIDDPTHEWFWDPESGELTGHGHESPQCNVPRPVIYDNRPVLYFPQNSSVHLIPIESATNDSNEVTFSSLEVEPITVHAFSHLRGIYFAEHIADIQRLAAAHNEWEIAVRGHDLHITSQRPFHWNDWLMTLISSWLSPIWQSWVSLVAVGVTIQFYRLLKSVTSPAWLRVPEARPKRSNENVCTIEVDNNNDGRKADIDSWWRRA